MVEMEVKAIKSGNSIRVAIPTEVLKASGVKEGDTLKIDWDPKAKLITLRKD
jgi:antitoxin component of MazEF toxin-antitoxin module